MGLVQRDPATRFEERFNDHERRLRQLERSNARYISFSDGTRERVRLGLQADGKYGLRIWDATGVLQSNLTW